MINPYKTQIDEEIAKGGEISIINVVNWLLAYACNARASDIHIDPNELDIKVRFRIDGNLNEAYILPIYLQDEVISRIKILSNLRTDEHQAPQDGRFRVTLPNSETVIDVRVAITPTYYGESAILRLLASKNQELGLEALGFSKENQTKILEALKQSHGMILATGPTGSGKTTTLYSILKICKNTLFYA